MLSFSQAISSVKRETGQTSKGKKSLQFLPLFPPGIVLGLGKSQFIFKSFCDLPENILIASSRFSIQCVTLRDIQLESQGFIGISNCITYNSSLSRIHTKGRSEAFKMKHISTGDGIEIRKRQRKDMAFLYTTAS